MRTGQTHTGAQSYWHLKAPYLFLSWSAGSGATVSRGPVSSCHNLFINLDSPASFLFTPRSDSGYKKPGRHIGALWHPLPIWSYFLQIEYFFRPFVSSLSFSTQALYYFTDLSSLHVLFSFSHFISTLSVAFFTLQGLAFVTVAALSSNATISQGTKWAAKHLLCLDWTIMPPRGLWLLCLLKLNKAPHNHSNITDCAEQFFYPASGCEVTRLWKCLFRFWARGFVMKVRWREAGPFSHSLSSVRQV